jgi:hypothetical protein
VLFLGAKWGGHGKEQAGQQKRAFPDAALSGFQRSI